MDSLEKTAVPKGYLLYTRIDGGGFDMGKEVECMNLSGKRLGTETTVEPGHVYDFKVVAFNDGGFSFPSETLSIGLPQEESKGPAGKAVMVVNNFDRVSAPAWFDTPEYAGFNDDLDSGVPYMYGIEFIGRQLQFKRDEVWLSDDSPGFGASDSDQAGKIIAGNTFDYPSIHGKALIENGYPFYSVSNEAFVEDLSCRSYAWMADIICGKQATTPSGKGDKGKYTVFPAPFRKAVSDFTTHGGAVLVSGANIGTDVWDGVYQIRTDSLETEDAVSFVEKTFGYRWQTNDATKTGEVKAVTPVKGLDGPVRYRTEPNGEMYCVETADAIVPASADAETVIKYADTGISAGVAFEAAGYKSVSIGFPLETIQDRNQLKILMGSIVDYLLR